MLSVLSHLTLSRQVYSPTYSLSRLAYYIAQHRVIKIHFT
jgi:hypothetical protein